MDEKTKLEIEMAVKMNVISAEQAAAVIKKLEANAKGTGTELKQAVKGGNEFSSVLGGLAAKAAGLLTVSAAISAIGQSINNYVESAGTTEQTSRDWLITTQGLNNTWLDVGRTLATAVLPMYKEIAGWIEQIATTTLPDLAKWFSDAQNPKSVNLGSNPNDAATKAQADPITNVLNKAVSDFIFGGFPKDTQKVMGDFFDFMGKWPANMQKLMDEAMTGKPLTIPPSALENDIGQGLGLPGYPAAIPSGERGSNATSGGPSLGERDEQAVATTKAANSEKEKTALLSDLKTMFNLRRQEEEVKRQFDRQAFLMNRAHEMQERYAVEDFDKSKKRELEDYQKQVRYAEEDFYRQRTIQARDFGISMVRNEQDYQLSRSRAAEDHQFDLYQIALSGDAMQYYLSQRQYNLSKKRAEEDHNIQVTRQKEDYTVQLKDQQEAFDIQQRRQKEQYDLMQTRQQEDYKIAEDRRAEAWKNQLDDLAYAISEEKRKRRQAFDDLRTQAKAADVQLLDLQGQFTSLQITQFENAMANEKAYIDTLYPGATGSGNEGSNNQSTLPKQNNSGKLLGSYAQGGYTKDEMARLHSGEFVMTKDTVNAAEEAAKGNKLSQDIVTRMITSSGGSGGLVYNDNRRIDTAVSSSDRAAINQDQRELLLSLLA